MYQVSYLNEEGTNLFRVRLIGFNQTIVLSRGFLVAKIGMDARTIIGCKELSVHEIIDLGFVLKESDKRLVI